ncbi:deoxyribonuclease-1-like 1 isoform X2 [Rhineura floridana]|uniref:deoxyribonuclease-1-like 1 isoform X2 n=1 Tax=Rhineura floridana TaxID=261503 RepID=UPI002AC86DB5|nr:deoxyribonuclease-1-like 1 isoform X2 [Rhineura floridana]XP_061470178.1 deoxyribonuclease-1-like 1 isoform X2 [Rhineura floridana]XP_061470179.1 deoxyribonuclease-1-like 1 isoform X2 [Rhineura floridana]
MVGGIKAILGRCSGRNQTRFLRMEPSCFLPLLLLLLLCPAAAPFRICAFNTQRFAQGKADKVRVMDTLVKILSRCDISVLQEVMDAKGKAIPALVAALNQYDRSSPYSYLTSPLLGRGNYQERYVFIYRKKRTRLLDFYSYEDNNPDRPDVFAREPFIVRFSVPIKKLPELVLIPQHTMPSKAEAEIDALYDVFLNVQARWGTEDMIFLGDFNADCGYVAKKRWGQIRLRQEPDFHWLIGDKVDTTVRENSRCAYDRIVVHGERCLAAVVPGSAQPFNFPKEFGLSEAEALEVSDHYPVEVELNIGHWRCQPASPAGLVLLAIAMLSGSGYGI